jgi:hypothetical protein
MPSFTLDEMADIATDLMLRAGKGFRAAGNNAVRLMVSMAPVDMLSPADRLSLSDRIADKAAWGDGVGVGGPTMTNFLERIYKNIESGAFGSTDRRDFFHALNWHSFDKPNRQWAENNHRIYDAAVKHGDAGIKAFITESGFADRGDPRKDKQQAKLLPKGYGYVKEQMPYVEAMHVYRLFNDAAIDDTFGLSTSRKTALAPRKKERPIKK